jgi:hypothetical protein
MIRVISSSSSVPRIAVAVVIMTAAVAAARAECLHIQRLDAQQSRYERSTAEATSVIHMLVYTRLVHRRIYR